MRNRRETVTTEKLFDEWDIVGGPGETAEMESSGQMDLLGAP